MMKIDARFLHKTMSFSDPISEKAALLKSLEMAPGIVWCGDPEWHFKGGYRVTFQIHDAQMDAFLEHVKTQGWVLAFF